MIGATKFSVDLKGGHVHYMACMVHMDRRVAILVPNSGF